MTWKIITDSGCDIKHLESLPEHCTYVNVPLTIHVGEEEFIDNLRQFIQKVTQHYGKKPLLYTFHNFYNRHFVGLFPDYHWMIARYRNDEPTLNDGKQYIIWQYTQSGRLGGIRGKVDRSQLMSNFSLRQLQM